MFLLPARATRFFQAYPHPDLVFDISSQYRHAIFPVSIPYLCIPFLLALVLFLVFLFHTLRPSRKPLPSPEPPSLSRLPKRQVLDQAFLLLSAFIHVAILSALALALIAMANLLFAIASAQDFLNAFKQTLLLRLRLPALALRLYATAAASLPLHQVSAPHLPVLNAFVHLRQPIDDLLLHADAQSAHVDALHNLFRNFVRILFPVLCVVAFFVLFILFSAFLTDLIPFHRKTSVFFIFLTLLLPFVLVALLPALLTPVAVASADFCTSLSHVQLTLNDSHSPKTFPQNYFISKQLHCPLHTSIANSLLHTTAFLQTLSANNSISQTLDLIRPSHAPHQQTWPSALSFSQTSLNQYQSCQPYQILLANLFRHVCSPAVPTVMPALADIWLVSIALPLLLLFLPMLLRLIQHPAADHLSALELLRLFGAPVPIRAFGDIRAVVSRHSTSRKRDFFEDTLLHPQPPHGTTQQIDPKVVEDYNLQDERMSTRRDPDVEDDDQSYRGSNHGVTDSASSSSSNPKNNV